MKSSENLQVKRAPANDGKKTLSRHEAAVLMGVSDQCMSNYIASGIVTGYKSKSGRIYIVKDSVDRWLTDFKPFSDRLSLARDYRARADHELRASRSLYASARQGCSVLRLLSDVDGRDLLQAVVHGMGHRHLSATQERTIVSFLENWDAARVMGEYHVTRMGFRMRVKKIIRILSGLPSYSALEDKIDALQKQVDALVVYNDELESCVKDLRAKLHIKERLESSGDDYDVEDAKMWDLLQTPVEDLGLGKRELSRLIWAGATNLAGIVSFKKTDLLEIQGFGRISLIRVSECLERFHLDFGMDVSRYRTAYMKMMRAAGSEDPG